MYITAAVLSVLLALVSLAAGVPKVLLKGDVPAGLQSHMGLSAGLVRFIGLAEVAAFVGLVVGLFWQPLGIAAAVGFGITMIGAVGFHTKAGDYADPATRGNAMAPIILALVSAATAVTLVLAM
ncbi:MULTISPECIES: DoxX family protein [unclassified Streptomyces]|uniref:DoxX family protein n=1 Tax=unclassified Streptomyces TaxID=2593676 RepID=UPI00224F914A|nr:MULTISPECIES: DoxX family protein [unclassified Streptomyces]MCX5328884.1 DoxX family protein [Streptomyces sp. NBC_00140]MCX5358295.1 DoxX family protein [Streptomyces sp. NBC_00124]